MRSLRIISALIVLVAIMFLATSCSDSTRPDTERSLEKRRLPDPFPIEFTHDSSISEIDAKYALQQIGYLNLQDHTNIFVGSPSGLSTTDVVAIVVGVRPDGRYECWLQNVTSVQTLQNYYLSSNDLDSMSIIDVDTGESLTVADLDAIVDEGSPMPHVEAVAVYLGIDLNTKGLRDLWNRIKDKWNGMTPCEQTMTVVGVVVCAFTSSGGMAVVCGGVFTLGGLAC